MSRTGPSPTVETVDVDADLSATEFDPSLSEDERRFYLKAYPNLDMVRERKVHCTTCKMHIGTAPEQERNIKMHPILRVTHCNKCHDFYNSGEFSKGEDGSELYCRWCGQGGEVYCCSNCPFVFCKSCIVKNLSRGVVADIEQNENWSCFNCAPKILWPLRAQHWALSKYIEKQKKSISEMNLPENEAKQEMMKDRSTCCRLAKAKCGNMSDSLESVDSLSRRSTSDVSTAGSASKKVRKLTPRSMSPAAKRPKSGNDEVVCTPDLLSMLEPDCQITLSSKSRPSQSPVASSPKVMSIQNMRAFGAGGNSNSLLNNSLLKNTPPPLVLRNTSVQVRPVTPSPIVRRTVVGSRTPSVGAGSASPVYHTINGFRIDLNSAAQQETFRLPNGKLIQVKRQGSANSSGATHPSATSPSPSASSSSSQVHNSWQRNIHLQQQQSSRPVQITPTQPSSQQQYPPQITVQQHSPQHHPQMLRYRNTMVGNTSVTQLHNGSSPQIHVINGSAGVGQPHHPLVAAQQQQQQTALRPVLMVRHVFPDTAIGQARTQLQEQVFNAMEICQHLTGKVQTLTNSNAYKQARNYLEVKELYIHLSYLLTYAIGRFKGLQDKCLGDMRQLGFVNDADSLENGQLAADKQASDDEDNEIEIVEPKTDTITLDSDNEDDVGQRTTATTTSSTKTSTQQLSLVLTSTTPPPPISSTQQNSSSNNNKQQQQPTNTVSIVPSETDFMANAQAFLASMLEVELSEGGADQISAQASPNGTIGGCNNGGLGGGVIDGGIQKKQPRKKTTNKPNPTLLKQKELLQRERLEEMKRSDMKLKMKCTIELKKVEEEYGFAKTILTKEGSVENADSNSSNKKEEDNVEVELVLVEDLDGSLEDEKSKAERAVVKKDGEREVGIDDKKLIEAAATVEKSEDNNKTESRVEKSVAIDSERDIDNIVSMEDGKTKETIGKKEAIIKIVRITENKIISSAANTMDGEKELEKKEKNREENMGDDEFYKEKNKNELENQNLDESEINANEKIAKVDANNIEVIEVPEEEEEEQTTGRQDEEETINTNKEIVSDARPRKNESKAFDINLEEEQHELKLEDEQKKIALTDADDASTIEPPSAVDNADMEIDVDKEIAKLLQNSKDVDTETTATKTNAANETAAKEDSIGTADDLMDDIHELISGSASNAMN